MLTYETLRTLVASEQGAPKLLPLPEDFFDQVQRYVKLKEQAAGPSGGRADELWELDAAKRVLADLLAVRERKLVMTALAFVRTGGQPGALLPHELALFNAHTEALKAFRETQSRLLEPGEQRAVVALLQDVPAFAGSDLKSYGPYKAGDIAAIPADTAKALTAAGAARELKA